MTTPSPDAEQHIRRWLSYAEARVVKARASIADAGIGLDYQWDLATLARYETQVIIYNRALADGGLERAAGLAVSLLTSNLGGSSTDAVANEIARQKAIAALEVLRNLAALDLDHATIGRLLVGVP